MTVLDGWKNYVRDVMTTVDASPAFTEANRCAFYSGAMWLFAVLMDLIKFHTGDEEAVSRKMVEIHEELEAFRNEVKAQVRARRNSGKPS